MTAPALLAHIVWGPAPDWLAAIGTVGALVVALVLFARDQEDRRRTQAGRVVCWLESVVEELPGQVPPWASPRIGARYLQLVLHNGSEEPVFDCWVRIVLDPTAPRTFREGSRWIAWTERIIPPGRTPRRLELPGSDLPHVHVRMEFTDANNRRWPRSHSGRLSQLVDPAQRAGASSRVGCGVLWYGPRR